MLESHQVNFDLDLEPDEEPLGGILLTSLAAPVKNEPFSGWIWIGFRWYFLCEEMSSECAFPVVQCPHYLWYIRCRVSTDVPSSGWCLCMAKCITEVHWLSEDTPMSSFQWRWLPVVLSLFSSAVLCTTYDTSCHASAIPPQLVLFSMCTAHTYLHYHIYKHVWA